MGKNKGKIHQSEDQGISDTRATDDSPAATAWTALKRLLDVRFLAILGGCALLSFEPNVLRSLTFYVPAVAPCVPIMCAWLNALHFPTTAYHPLLCSLAIERAHVALPQPISSAERVPIPFLNRSDLEWVQQYMGQGRPVLFTGPSNSGKTTAFQFILAQHSKSSPAIYISGKTETKISIWGSIADAFGFPFTNSSQTKQLIEHALRERRAQDLPAPWLFIDDVHLFFRADKAAMSALCKWTISLIENKLLSVSFLSSEWEVVRQLSTLPRMKERLSMMRVPPVPVADVKQYLRNATRLTSGQIASLLETFGASVVEAGNAVARFQAYSSSKVDDSAFEAFIQERCAGGLAAMREAIEAATAIAPPAISREDAYNITHAILEALAAEEGEKAEENNEEEEEEKEEAGSEKEKKQKKTKKKKKDDKVDLFSLTQYSSPKASARLSLVALHLVELGLLNQVGPGVFAFAEGRHRCTFALLRKQQRVA